MRAAAAVFTPLFGVIMFAFAEQQTLSWRIDYYAGVPHVFALNFVYIG